MRFKRGEEEIIMMRNGKFTVTTCVLTAANCAVGLLLMSAVILAVLLGGAGQTTSAAFFAAEMLCKGAKLLWTGVFYSSWSRYRTAAKTRGRRDVY